MAEEKSYAGKIITIAAAMVFVCVRLTAMFIGNSAK